MKAPNGDDGRMFRITGEISKRPDGSEYYECNDGIQREVGPRNPPPSQDHLQELFQRCAQAIGIDDSPEYWRLLSRIRLLALKFNRKIPDSGSLYFAPQARLK